MYLPHGELWAGLIVGEALGMIGWIRDDPPETIAKWRRGADGERRTAAVLRALEGAGWRAVHDRAAERGNLDHVAVSPAGVFLLESKNYSGSITVEGEELVASFGPASIDSFATRTLARAMRGRAAELKNRIQTVTKLRCFVHAVVVIWGDFPDRLVSGDRVTFVAGNELRNWLAAHDATLSARDVSLIALALAADEIAPPAPDFGVTPA
jgi:hypothetical protein